MRGEGKGKIRNNVILTDFRSLVESYYAQGTRADPIIPNGHWLRVATSISSRADDYSFQ